jgi:uncharacterized membrane protein
MAHQQKLFDGVQHRYNTFDGVGTDSRGLSHLPSAEGKGAWMIAVILALSASLGWGVSDFLGGLRTRKSPVSIVLAVSQLSGLIAVGPVLLLRAQDPPLDGRLLFAVAAGIASFADLGLVYLAMAKGPMSVVAPIAAAGAAVPAMVGIAGGDRLTAAAACGLVCALLGAIIASTEPGRGRKSARSVAAGGLLALAAAVAIGAFFVLFDIASAADPYWAAGSSASRR